MTASITIEERTEFAVRVGLQLRTVRKQKRLSQSEVAALTGGLVTKGALASYELHNRSIRIEILWIILEALGENISDFLHTIRFAQSTSLCSDSAISIRKLFATLDPRLAMIKRWWKVDHHDPVATTTSVIKLTEPVLVSLAYLMNTTSRELLELLKKADVLA